MFFSFFHTRAFPWGRLFHHHHHPILLTSTTHLGISVNRQWAADSISFPFPLSCFFWRLSTIHYVQLPLLTLFSVSEFNPAFYLYYFTLLYFLPFYTTHQIHLSLSRTLYSVHLLQTVCGLPFLCHPPPLPELTDPSLDFSTQQPPHLPQHARPRPFYNTKLRVSINSLPHRMSIQPTNLRFIGDRC